MFSEKDYIEVCKTYGYDPYIDDEDAAIMYQIETYTESFRMFSNDYEYNTLVFIDEYDAAEYYNINVEIIFEAEDYREELYTKERDNEAMAVRIEIENQQYNFCWE